MSQKEETFLYQDTLPRLPIPPVEHTISSYLDSLKPILSPQELKVSTEVARKFNDPSITQTRPDALKNQSVAQILQNRLISYEKTQQFHWLEKWWEEAAYLTWREPLIINSNYWLTFETLPFAYDKLNNPEFENSCINLSRKEKGYLVVTDAGFGEFQIRLAAAVANRSLDFSEIISNQSYPTEKAAGKAICMNQYLNLFGITRIPRTQCDQISKYKGRVEHFIIMAKNQLFKIPFYTKCGQRLLDGDLESLIFEAIMQVEKLPPSEVQPPVGILTAGHRDRWSVGFSKLTSDINSISFNTIEEIKKSAFLISLEDYYSPDVGGFGSWQRLVKNCAKVGHNRWFDKHINYVIDRNGNLGLNGEHSPVDAVVPAKLYDYIIRSILKSPITKNAKSKSILRVLGFANAEIPSPQHLKFDNVDSEIYNMINETEVEIKKIESHSISDTFLFKGFGANFIKKSKIAPDAFVQIMLQLTYFRLYQEFAPTYESASTRMYNRGRTDTIRSLSQENKDFVLTMCSNDCSNEQKYKMLTKAAEKHVKTSRLAAQGLGIDRHILGLKYSYLKLAPLPNEPKFPKEIADLFFNDPAMSKSSFWKLSTSGLFPNNTLVHTCFGCVPFPKCYGMNYTIMPDYIKFSIETKRGPGYEGSDLYKFIDQLNNSFLDTKNTIEKALNVSLNKNDPYYGASKTSRL
ncbi:hypothetical protein BB561_004561 [Smittium simulii]|uniref:Choline/carnitine acyltransferase domain-containing protein n=1 Tax=Smittium simulii TaxID=133385 RepID=A0A2T9YFJ2_9FUNG|nr:hypothetical protein BB561_004561 [Smittium simulii]